MGNPSLTLDRTPSKSNFFTVNRVRYKPPKETLELRLRHANFVMNSSEAFENFMQYQSSLLNKLVLLSRSEYNELYPYDRYEHRNFRPLIHPPNKILTQYGDKPEVGTESL